jgi:hypothetical protein
MPEPGSRDLLFEVLVCPLVICEVHRTVRAQSLLVLTNCKISVHPITNPKPSYSHSKIVTVIYIHITGYIQNHVFHGRVIGFSMVILFIRDFDFTPVTSA